MDIRSIIAKLNDVQESPAKGDVVYLEFGDTLEVETTILEVNGEDIVLEADDKLVGLLEDLNTIEERKIYEGSAAWLEKQKQNITTEEYDKSHGSPYDRGAADSYYGRNPRPHKLAPAVGGVQGQMEKVPLTDPKEIAAYNAGYEENQDFKDYGESTEKINEIHEKEAAQLIDAARKMFPDNSHPVHKSVNDLIYSIGYGKGNANKYADEIRQHLSQANEISEVETLDEINNPDTLRKVRNRAAGRMMDDPRDEKAHKVEKQASSRLKKITDKEDDERSKREYKAWKEEIETLDEAEYRGRNIKLGKPFLTPDGPKKRSVYVKNSKGNIVKVNFGDKKMRIKKSNPKRRKSFRARHNCANPGPRHKARYWSCKFW
jgi:hypothetical protein